ncbi:oligosaccharide flippase family protein [Celeribacter baekdonensis]|uniref:Polysaccharide biosynthesis protein n=1 Tax=Celeribacter baekdonensis B30 TaxID=1208323 RepID=K2JIP0_9RHOB|nr:oligosaccharide flippase family protein [Celeribacter baekdonensis]EKE74337.1 hypothetical protein B30_01385 [Celeribacter baekdonensis B30]
MAVNMNVLVLDFGLTSALTLRISQVGVQDTAPILRRLSRLTISLGLLGLLFALAAWQFNMTAALGIGLAAVSALPQLMSNWLIAIRMGQHQQHWFNFKTVLRVVVQTTIVIICIKDNTAVAWFIFGSALLAGGVAEFALIYVIVRREFEWKGRTSKLGALKILTSGFGLENLSQRGFQPLSQVLIGALLGPAAVGIFSVALRIPVAINQAFSQALRTLLPGVSSFLQAGDEAAAIRLVRNGFVSQVMLVTPASLFLLLYTDLILVAWLGETPSQLILATQIFSGSMVFTALSTPFYWVAQATGRVHALGRLGIATLIAMLICVTVLVSLGGGILECSILFALSQAVRSVGACIYGAGEHNFLRRVLSDLRWGRLFAFFATFTLFNLIIMNQISTQPPAKALLLVTGLNAVLFGPLVIFALSKNAIVQKEKVHK